MARTETRSGLMSSLPVQPPHAEARLPERRGVFDLMKRAEFLRAYRH